MSYMAQQGQGQYGGGGMGGGIGGGWPDAAGVYAQYMQQAYPPYGNPYAGGAPGGMVQLGFDGATGPNELKPARGSPVKALVRKGPRTGGFAR